MNSIKIESKSPLYIIDFNPSSIKTLDDLKGKINNLLTTQELEVPTIGPSPLYEAYDGSVTLLEHYTIEKKNVDIILIYEVDDDGNFMSIKQQCTDKLNNYLVEFKSRTTNVRKSFPIFVFYPRDGELPPINFPEGQGASILYNIPNKKYTLELTDDCTIPYICDSAEILAGGKKQQKLSKSNEKIKIGNQTRVVYLGTRGGRYVKMGGNVVPVSKLNKK